MPLMAPGENLLSGHWAKLLSPFFGKSSDVLDRLLMPLPSAFRIGSDAGDPPTVPQDDDRRAALDLVEQLREMRLRHRGLNFLHIARLLGSVPRKRGGVFAETPPVSVRHCECL